MLTKAKNHLPAQLLTPAIKFTRSTAALSNETAKAVFLAKTLEPINYTRWVALEKLLKIEIPI